MLKTIYRHKHLYVTFAATLFSLLCSINVNAYEKIDKIIAIIGEDVIFSSDMDREIQQAKVRLKAQGRPINNNDLQQRTIDNLVIERLQLNMAEKNNISASQQEIETALVRTKKNLQEKGILFKQYLNDQGLTEEGAKKELEKELIINKIQQGIVRQRAKITEREIDNFLDSKAGKEWLTPKFRIGHIFLPNDRKNKKKTLKKAKSIRNILAKPKNNFGQLAQKYSKGPNASKGGDLGLQKQDDLPESFVSQAQTLKIGEVSQPFISNAGVHIIKLLHRQGAKAVIVNQYKVRHILIKATELFTEQEAKDKINSLYQDLIAGTDFSSLAIENTDDIGTKSNGGDLGWSNPGSFVPEFERVMHKLSIGKVSKPFKTQFGWHVLRVDEQRSKDIFETVKRNQVANILRRQRFSDEVQIWLQELRDNAYVEILI